MWSSHLIRAEAHSSEKSFSPAKREGSFSGAKFRLHPQGTARCCAAVDRTRKRLSVPAGHGQLRSHASPSLTAPSPGVWAVLALGLGSLWLGRSLEGMRPRALCQRARSIRSPCQGAATQHPLLQRRGSELRAAKVPGGQASALEHVLKAPWRANIKRAVRGRIHV